MAEVKRVYKQMMPAMKLVGRCYDESEKVNNTFGYKWEEWFKNNLFAPLKLDDEGEEMFDGSDAYIGMSRCKEGEPYQYWIGVFMPPDATVPKGYESLDFDAGEIAVCWIYGKEPDIYFHCCMDSLSKENMEWKADKNGIKWCFERYVSARFTQPDEKGNVILDMCFYLRSDE